MDLRSKITLMALADITPKTIQETTKKLLRRLLTLLRSLALISLL